MTTKLYSVVLGVYLHVPEEYDPDDVDTVVRDLLRTMESVPEVAGTEVLELPELVEVIR